MNSIKDEDDNIVKEWLTSHFISPIISGDESPNFGIVILNQPIELTPFIFSKLWRQGYLFTLLLTRS